MRHARTGVMWRKEPKLGLVGCGCVRVASVIRERYRLQRGIGLDWAWMGGVGRAGWGEGDRSVWGTGWGGKRGRKWVRDVSLVKKGETAAVAGFSLVLPISLAPPDAKQRAAPPLLLALALSLRPRPHPLVRPLLHGSQYQFKC